jgi:serine phosphatase RsbU (regulator of sigma subunit)
MPGTNPHPGFAAPHGDDAVRLQQIAQVSAELGAADTMDAVIEAAVNHAADAIGASVSTLMLTEGEHLRLVAGRGLQQGVEVAFGRFSLRDRNPASEAATSAQPIVLASGPQIERDYPVLEQWIPDGRSLVCLPLGSTQPAPGVIGLTFDAGWVPGPTEMDFLTAFADTCGQAVRRIRASDIARERADRFSYIAKISAELASSLDYRRTLTHVADLLVPQLADWAAVDVVVDGVPVTLAVAHTDPEKVRWAWELQEKYPPDPTATSGAANVVRTGLSELYPQITDEMLVAGARDEDHLRLSRELNLRSALVVPLVARGRTLGAMTLIRTEGGIAYGDADLAFAEDVGRRAGIAIDNAQLYRQAENVALQLQRAVLPEERDDIPGWEIAAHYAPGGRGGVGGDFYDGMALADGNLAFVIGDVMGHGLRAAAAMAQLRSAVRAFFSIDPDPTSVVGNLDTMFEKLAIAQPATLLYGVAEPSRGRLRFVNAGHYPPLLVVPGRAPAFVDAPHGLPLGAGGDARTVATVEFDDAATLLLYTDGLVEKRGEVVDAGLSRLVQAGPRLIEADLAAALDDVVLVLAGTDAEDDVTAMAFRRRSGADVTE